VSPPLLFGGRYRPLYQSDILHSFLHTLDVLSFCYGVVLFDCHNLFVKAFDLVFAQEWRSLFDFSFDFRQCHNRKLCRYCSFVRENDIRMEQIVIPVPQDSLKSPDMSLVLSDRIHELGFFCSNILIPSLRVRLAVDLSSVVLGFDDVDSASCDNDMIDLDALDAVIEKQVMNGVSETGKFFRNSTFADKTLDVVSDGLCGFSDYPFEIPHVTLL
jgi:hypothetical protein